MLVRQIRGLLDLLDDAEEVGRLHDHGRGTAIESPFQIGQIQQTCVPLISKLLHRHSQVASIGLKHFPIFGVHGSRDQHAMASGNAAMANGPAIALGAKRSFSVAAAGSSVARRSRTMWFGRSSRLRL